MAAAVPSAREVCGDLYEFLRYGPTATGIALERERKGTAAALYGAVAIGIMRSLAPQKLQRREMLKQMNQLVGERPHRGVSCGCFCHVAKEENCEWQPGNRQRCSTKMAGAESLS